MIHTIDKVIPEHIKQEYSHTTCDLCKETIRSSDPQASILFEDIEYNYSGSEGVKESVELCEECYKDKLIPWFKENNITPTVTEVEL